MTPPKEDVLPQTRILVVDDSKVNRFLMSELMKNMKVLVDTANDGHEALEKCKNVKYDLIFMDIVMPDQDGFETTEKIFQELNLSPKVYAVTSSEDEGLHKKCYDVGMEAILPKPVDIEQLKQILKMHSS